jgi:hypothetical protein
MNKKLTAQERQAIVHMTKAIWIAVVTAGRAITGGFSGTVTQAADKMGEAVDEQLRKIT